MAHKTLLPVMRKIITHTVQVQNMPIHKRLLAVLKRIYFPVQKVPRYRKTNRHTATSSPANPVVEAQSGRRDIRGSINSQVKHLWDASEKPPRMGELLRKHTIRTRKDEEVQRAKEEEHQRSVIITEWAKREGYNIFVAFLQQIESDGYYRLRNNHGKQPNENTDYYIGKQNGRLEVIEDIRLFFAYSRMKLQEHLESKKEEANKNAVQNNAA